VADLDMNQIIHAAVRRDLARTEAALRSLPDGDADRAVELQRAWAALWGQLRHHHEQEDEHVWPYVRTLAVVDPAVVDAMESEHHAMAAACEAAAAAIDTVAADPTATNAAAAADAVAEAARITDAHLEHEERAITPVIRERMETREWKAIEAEFRKGGPVQGGQFLAWLQDGGDPEVLAALRSTIPPPVLFILSRVYGRSYHRNVAPVWR
jgi:hemerythrin-like domain-containing protein